MATIIAHVAVACHECGGALSIDQNQTAKNAVEFMGLLSKKQVADKMEISPSYLGDLTTSPPHRRWNIVLAQKFEAAVTLLKK